MQLYICNYVFDIISIAGSRTGGRISSQSSELDSPGVHSTVHSWDSHANYHGHYGNSDHRPGSSSNALHWSHASHVVIYCDIQGHLRTTTGLVRILLLVSTIFLYLKLEKYSVMYLNYIKIVLRIDILTNTFHRYCLQLVWGPYTVLALPRSVFLCCL